MLEIKDLEISTFLIGNSMTQVAGDSQGKTIKQARNNVILKQHNGFKSAIQSYKEVEIVVRGADQVVLAMISLARSL